MVINGLPVGFKDGLRHFSSQQKHLIKPSSGQITPNRSLGAQHQWLQWNIWAQKKTTSFLYVGMGSLHIYAYMASWWSGSKSANKILGCEMMWATIQLDPLWHVYICYNHPHFDFLCPESERHTWVPGSPDTTMELGSGVKVATGTSAVQKVVPQSVGVEVQQKTWDWR